MRDPHRTLSRTDVSPSRRKFRPPAPHFMITIPNTVDGAVLLSIIDFLLSFFIISGIGVILAVLPVVNRFWKIDEAKLRRGGH
jgi:hypothetical protein